ncbi:MAG: hypothetical protein KAS16_05785, partial [Thermoplasmata archaeon]|nr:hypothetical protein [Thermoplasmata archaeon]
MYNRIKGYSSIVITLIMIFSVVMTPNISNARDPIIIINAQNDGWNDTFENMSYVSAYSNVTIMNNDVILNVNSPFVPSTWAKQGLAFSLGASPENWMNLGETVIKDNGIYKMWYSGVDLTMTYRIFYATSNDGINWNKQGLVMNLGAPGSSEDNHVATPHVLKDGPIYKMWYGGHDDSNWRIHYATSLDGISWTRFGVVVPLGGLPGGTDDKLTIGQTILKEDGEFRMWYGGSDIFDVFRIHYATSIDGISWTRFGVVVPLGGLPGGTDDKLTIGQ